MELAASASSTPYGSFTVSNTMASGNSTPNAAAGGGTAGSGALTSKTASSRQHPPGLVPSQASNSVNSRKYSGAGGGPVDPTLAAISATAGGDGGVVRAGRGGSGLRVCGSSMVRCVSPKEGAVVSVHHFNTELGSPLVYGTRKGGVRSWDLRAREVRRAIGSEYNSDGWVFGDGICVGNPLTRFLGFQRGGCLSRMEFVG